MAIFDWRAMAARPRWMGRGWMKVLYCAIRSPETLGRGFLERFLAECVRKGGIITAR
jgi:hypothetical protein